MSIKSADYGDGAAPEHALKSAARHTHGGRSQLIEGVIEPLSLSWAHETVTDRLRHQLGTRAADLHCIIGSGDLDLPGSPNWYVPDLAVVPAAVAKGAGALRSDQTLLIVEVTSEADADTDRIVKRRRYAEYGAPLYLLVDRQQRALTLFAEPDRLGYTRITGPLPYGTPLRVPYPFGTDLDTSDL
ncbi:Uma2 family endonuclease [Streptomyces chrestomyceticus]|uniref:Uma2 family endonuclease n=1 Tax=Streptomyces chrestomyceticus TaxID=68185 RepID=UPI0037A66AF6